MTGLLFGQIRYTHLHYRHAVKMVLDDYTVLTQKWLMGLLFSYWLHIFSQTCFASLYLQNTR